MLLQEYRRIRLEQFPNGQYLVRRGAVLLAVTYDRQAAVRAWWEICGFD